MSCKDCQPNITNVLNYNASIGKYILQNSKGDTFQSELVSNSTVHGFSTILASQNAFIADSGAPIKPIPKAKLLEDTPQNFIPCFIFELQYDIPIVDIDTLDNIVPCQSTFYSAGQILSKGVVSPNAHFCAKVCARELYFDSPGFAKVTHVPSDEFTDCSVLPDPGYIYYTDLTFLGVDNYGKAVISAPIGKDFPGLEPAVHRTLSIASASVEFSYFGICPQGISAYSGITAFVGSRGEIFTGLPSLICVPLCSSASAIYSSSHNANSITQGYSAYPDTLLIASIVYSEWMLGDILPIDASGNRPDPPFTYMLPIGQSNSCGFSDNSSGREYFLNDYVDANRPIVFPQSQIGNSLITTDANGDLIANVRGPNAYRRQLADLHIDQGQPIDNDFSSLGIYTHIINNGVPKIQNGLLSMERLPYRESTILYDRDYKPLRTIRDFVVVVPEAKQPGTWAAYSLIRMKKAETDFTPTFDEASLSLITSEIGDRVFASCKYGFYEPADITTNDQLKTAYADYLYSLTNEGIDNFAQGLIRADANFSPNRRQGNYGYEPYITPGDPIPADVTPCQDALKHTHSAYLDGSAYAFVSDFITNSEQLAQALLSNVTHDFTLNKYNCTDPNTIISSEPTHISISGIADAINAYFLSSAPGNTVADITFADILRIKPLII